MWIQKRQVGRKRVRHVTVRDYPALECGETAIKLTVKRQCTLFSNSSLLLRLLRKSGPKFLGGSSHSSKNSFLRASAWLSFLVKTCFHARNNLGEESANPRFHPRLEEFDIIGIYCPSSRQILQSLFYAESYWGMFTLWYVLKDVYDHAFFCENVEKGTQIHTLFHWCH